MKIDSLHISGDIALSGDFNIAAHINSVSGAVSSSPKADALVLFINSSGGDLVYGLEVCNAIKNSPIPVVSIISPAAESAAALIAMVCDRTLIMENGWIMTHQFSSAIEGTYNDQKTMQKHNEILHSAMVSILADKTGMSAMNVEDTFLPNHDVWLTAEEAKELGVVDGVVQLGTDLREVICHVLRD